MDIAINLVTGVTVGDQFCGDDEQLTMEKLMANLKEDKSAGGDD